MGRPGTSAHSQRHIRAHSTEILFVRKLGATRAGSHCGCITETFVPSGRPEMGVLSHAAVAPTPQTLLPGDRGDSFVSCVAAEINGRTSASTPSRGATSAACSPNSQNRLVSMPESLNHHNRTCNSPLVIISRCHALIRGKLLHAMEANEQA